MKPKLAPQIIAAAGQDAVNRSMRKAGRKVWNLDDYAAACTESERLWDVLDEQKNLEQNSADRLTS